MAKKNFIEKIKGANIPNSYYALIALAFISVIGVVYLINIGVSTQQIKREPDAPVVKKKLTKPARYAHDIIDIDMSREQVIAAMGPADWAAIPGDSGMLSLPDNEFGLELRWSNPDCRDVVVSFSPPPYKVIGWDAGSDFCRMGLKEEKTDFSCDLPDRSKLCK